MEADAIQLYLYFAAAMAIAGIAAGFLAGLLGVGGGIIIVPVLFQAFTDLDVEPSIRMHIAVGTSLATIVFTATTSSLSHWRRGSVDLSLLSSWGPWIFAGAVLGMAFFGNVNSTALTLIFACTALAVAGYMIITAKKSAAIREALPGTPGRQGLALGIGGLSAVMGIGGGTLSVPVLSLFSFPVRRAIGTAAAVGLIIAIPGTFGAVIAGLGDSRLPPFSLGYVNLLGFVLLVPLTVSIAPLGARLAHTAPPTMLRYGFGGFLLLSAANMIWKTL